MTLVMHQFSLLLEQYTKMLWTEKRYLSTIKRGLTKGLSVGVDNSSIDGVIIDVRLGLYDGSIWGGNDDSFDGVLIVI